MRIAANRAEQLFPGGFRLRAHVGDTVRTSLIFEILSLCYYHIMIQQVHTYLTCQYVPPTNFFFDLPLKNIVLNCALQ